MGEAATVIGVGGCRVLAEGDGGEVVVGTVGAERVHERASLDVPVEPSEGTAVAIAGASGQAKGPVDDTAAAALTNALAACGSANRALS